jgi:hypothetical protein
MMAYVRIDFQRRRNVETFPWTRVQPIREGVQFPLGVDRRVRAFRQVLAQQTIGVFIGTALPGTMGSAKTTRSANRWAMSRIDP